MSQICEEPPRSEMKAMRLESGDQRGRSLLSPSRVIRRGVPPATGHHVNMTRPLVAGDVHGLHGEGHQLPSGEICGLADARQLIRASTSKGCFWARTAAADAARGGVRGAYTRL